MTNTNAGGITIADLMRTLKPGQDPSQVWGLMDGVNGRQFSWEDPSWASAFSGGANVGALSQQSANAANPANIYSLMQQISQAKGPQQPQANPADARRPVVSGQSLFDADQAKGFDTYKPMVQPHAGDYRQQFGLLR